MQNPTEARRDTHTYIYTDRHTCNKCNKMEAGSDWPGYTALTVYPRLVWNSKYRPGWPSTKRFASLCLLGMGAEGDAPPATLN